MERALNVYDLQIIRVAGETRLRPVTPRGAAWLYDHTNDPVGYFPKVTNLCAVVKEILASGLTVTHS